MPDKPKRQRTRHVGAIKSKLRPVIKSSISDKIVDQIMSLIASGDLKPGQRLPAERELCQHFGAGRSSLREALRCLCIVGVLSARAGEGTSVASDGGKFLGKIVEWRIITEQHDIEDLVQARIALESVTAACAARLAGKEELARFDLLLTKMKAAVVDEKRFAALDLEFHVTVAAASKNFLIYDLVSTIRGQFAKALTRVLLLPNARPLSLNEHISIIHAIRCHDPIAASKAMQDHLEAVLKRYHTALANNSVDSLAYSQRKLSSGHTDTKRSDRPDKRRIQT
jgi:GntR family transcriptional repressor for pyruvate dehydrogenase complex